MDVVLVRHAVPELAAGVSPADWPLSEAGRRSASHLRDRLPADAWWLSSTEPKAEQTLRLVLGDDVPIVIGARPRPARLVSACR